MNPSYRAKGVRAFFFILILGLVTRINKGDRSLANIEIEVSESGVKAVDEFPLGEFPGLIRIKEQEGAFTALTGAGVRATSYWLPLGL